MRPDDASSSGETNAHLRARANRASISVTVVVVGGVTLLGFVNEEPRRFTDESPEKARLENPRGIRATDDDAAAKLASTATTDSHGASHVAPTNSKSRKSR